MKREELEKFGLTKEQIDKVCDLNKYLIQKKSRRVAHSKTRGVAGSVAISIGNRQKKVKSFFTAR